jgi:hypothetical protein
MQTSNVLMDYAKRSIRALQLIVVQMLHALTATVFALRVSITVTVTGAMDVKFPVHALSAAAEILENVPLPLVVLANKTAAMVCGVIVVLHR